LKTNFLYQCLRPGDYIINATFSSSLIFIPDDKKWLVIEILDAVNGKNFVAPDRRKISLLNETGFYSHYFWFGSTFRAEEVVAAGHI
jgi:hypothetical protein